MHICRQTQVPVILLFVIAKLIFMAIKLVNPAAEQLFNEKRR